MLRQEKWKRSLLNAISMEARPTRPILPYIKLVAWNFSDRHYLWTEEGLSLAAAVALPSFWADSTSTTTAFIRSRGSVKTRTVLNNGAHEGTGDSRLSGVVAIFP